MLTEKDEMLTDQDMSFIDKKEWFCPETKKLQVSIVSPLLETSWVRLYTAYYWAFLFDVTTTISVFQNNERDEK